MLRNLILFALAALFEIFGCVLMMVFIRSKMWLALGPALLCLCIFAGLLSLHTSPSGRVYAIYGGIYVFVSFLWLYFVDKVSPTNADFIGVACVLTGAIVIASQLE
jgi:small multidrug resistance family-3 protein